MAEGKQKGRERERETERMSERGLIWGGGIRKRERRGHVI